ncbi:hypothetical protein JL721_4765 [Aureococcus anophagefferens]|nr:hypothetical protein JL721_4765 [Aureococcus anophagefferens]
MGGGASSEASSEVSLVGHSGPILAVAFSASGEVVATGSKDCTARLYDAASGALKITLSGHGESVLSCAFSGDGGRVVTGGGDAAARDDRRVLTGCADGVARIFDLAAPAAPPTRLEGHAGAVYDVRFAPDEAAIATAGHDATVRLWDATGAAIRTLTGHGSCVYAVAFAPRGARVVSGPEDRTARVWDVATGAALLTLAGHLGDVSSVAYSGDGAVILTGSEDRTLRLWDAESGALRRTCAKHRAEVNAAAFSADRIVTGSKDRTARIVDLQATLDEKPRRSFFRRKEAGVDPFPDEPELDLDGSGDDESHGS